VRFLYIGISVICFLGLLFVLKSNTSLSSDVVDYSANLNNSRTKSVTEGLLDGCYHVYLDVGSNVGVQVRKLYQPELYPDAPVNGLFKETFGPVEARRKAVCAIGFEPNPHHTKILTDIQRSYQACGWRAHFLTQTGVSNHSGEGTFYSDGAMQMKEWGGGVLPPDVISEARNASAETITLLRLSDFLRNVVGKRQMPFDSNRDQVGPPKVLMKMDIEGSEIDVLPDVLFNGGLGAINGLMVEMKHEWMQKIQARKDAHKQLSEIFDKINLFSKNMGMDFEMLDLDDESYATSVNPLPKC